jgi:DNA-binding CsgD family transcriptional regulator
MLVIAAVSRRSGVFVAAAAALDEAEALVDSGQGLFSADTDLERARLWRVVGEPDRAEEDAHAALRTAFEGGFRRTVILALEELAHLGAASGSIHEAARLLGACRAARGSAGLVPTAEEQRWLDDTGTAIGAGLGEDGEAAAALSEGERLSLDEAVAYARRARGERGRPSAGWGSLTPTERRVVDLVLDGLSNPQIAERVFMSRGTVKSHLTHIFTKLGVSTRAELAAMAARRIT